MIPACQPGLIVAAAGLLLSGSAGAEFLTVNARLVPDSGAPPCHQTWRFDAVFSAPTDRLIAIGGATTLGEFRLETRDVAGIQNDGGPLAGTAFEDFPGLGASWDSWVTIGSDTFPADVAFSPGFGGVPAGQTAITGTLVTEDDGGWLATGPPPPPIDAGDGTWSVLIAQVTVRESACPLLSGWAFWNDADTPGPPRHFYTGALSCFPCHYDLDDDGFIGFPDLLTLLAAWGTDSCVADVDDSGTVDFADMLGLLASWGDCIF